MREPIPFAGTYNERTSKTVSAQKLVNWYAELADSHGGKRLILNQRPGLVLEGTYTVGPHRGAYEHIGKLYFVSYNTLYSKNTSNTDTTCGTINTYTGRVGMASNGFYMIIVDGTDGWLWDGTTLDQITDLDFVDATQVKFLHGRFIINKPGTGEFYISTVYPAKADLIDGTGWQSLAFATAEVDPDNLLALEVDKQELWLFGDFTTELYFDSGNATFPFESQPGGAIEWGIAAPWSVAKGDSTVVWLGKNRNGGPQVVATAGFSPQVISTDAVEEAMSGYTVVDDAFAFIMKGMDKSYFYVLTFPTANVTWAYNMSLPPELGWHQWSNYGVGRFRGATYCYFNGKRYVGDALDGRLYSLSETAYDDNGDVLERIAVAQTLELDGDDFSINELEIEFDSGVGLISGQGSDPQAMLRISKDHGHIWGNSRWRTIGQIGKYKNRAIWRQMGQFNNFTPELRVTDPIKATVVSARVVVERTKN
jgi:hypothetical protein